VLRDGRGDRMGALGDLLEGEATMATLAIALRPWAGRAVANNTGLSYDFSHRLSTCQDGHVRLRTHTLRDRRNGLSSKLLD
jgi:hypothetical protein